MLLVVAAVDGVAVGGSCCCCWKKWWLLLGAEGLLLEEGAEGRGCCLVGEDGEMVSGGEVIFWFIGEEKRWI